MSLMKSSQEKDVENKIALMIAEVGHIYANKSSDEYKMRGDITKAKVYHGIESMLSNLPTLKGFPKNDIRDLKEMFNAMHRPIYKKMVQSFIDKPDEQNVVYTAIFTFGYRVLVGELSRIFASTVATDNGLVYKPDKISRSQNGHAFIVAFNKNMDQKIDEYVRKNYKNAELHKEGYITNPEGQQLFHEGFGSAIGVVAKFITDNELLIAIPVINDLVNLVFGRHRMEYNPISYIHHVLTEHYDKKVKEFYGAQALYEETVKAYDEYKKIPTSDRKRKVEAKYVKMIKKYNIRMENLRAKIAHYDSRAMEEVKQKQNTKTTTSKPTPKPDSDGSRPNNDHQPTTPPDMDTTPGDDVNTPVDNSTGGEDLDW